jgi:hypothetical protein
MFSAVDSVDVSNSPQIKMHTTLMPLKNSKTSPKPMKFSQTLRRDNCTINMVRKV